MNNSERRKKGNLYLSLEILAGTRVHTHMRMFLLLVPMLSKPTCYTHRNHFLDAKPGSTTSC